MGTRGTRIRLATPGERSATTVAHAPPAGWWSAQGRRASARTSRGTHTRWETRGPPIARVAPVGQGGKSRAGKAAARAPARMSGDLFIRWETSGRRIATPALAPTEV